MHISLELYAKTFQPAKEELKIIIDGQKSHCIPMHIEAEPCITIPTDIPIMRESQSASVLKRNINLFSVNAKDPLTNYFDFGVIYVGHSKVQTVFLRNDTEEEIECKALVKKDDEGGSFSVFPSLIKIKPSDVGELHIKYKPTRATSKHSLPTHFQIEVKTQETLIKTMNMFAKGKAVPLQVAVDKAQLDFGSIHVGKETKLTATLKNDSHHLKAFYCFMAHSHIHVHPFNGELEPQREQLVTITFKPRQMGPLVGHLRCALLSQPHRADLHEPSHPLAMISMDICGNALAPNIVRPSSPTMNPDQKPYLDWRIPETRQEWQEKKKHASQYDNYIRNNRIQRALAHFQKALPNHLPFKSPSQLAISQSYSHVDPVSGLEETEEPLVKLPSINAWNTSTTIDLHRRETIRCLWFHQHALRKRNS
jgi:hypothetical protein